MSQFLKYIQRKLYKILSVPEEPTSPSTPGIPDPMLRRSQRATKVMTTWLRDLGIALALAAFIILFLYQPVKVEGTSMMPSLDDQERIFINKFVYSIESIEPGDVVVFHYPRDPSTSYIKRVIAVAGDKVRIDDGQVFVNNKPIVEDYVASIYVDDRSYPEIVVPAHSYFVLGDHRNMSRDSRDFGPVNERFIYGKAVFGYWPFDKMGRVH